MAKKKADMERFHHANLYYVTMVVSMILALFNLVQGIKYHFEDELYFALGFYTITILFIVIAKSSYTRGKGHYHYHSHIE